MIVRPLNNDLYWRCFFGLAVVGLFSTLGPAIALGVVNPWSALPVVVGGIFKAVGYMIGWAIKPIAKKGDGNFDEATEIGEFLTGIFAYAGFGIGLFMVF